MADLRSDDPREALVALRDVLVRELESGCLCVKCGGGVSSPTASLAKQYRDTVAALAALTTPEGSKTDELKRKRAERQARVAERAASGQ